MTPFQYYLAHAPEVPEWFRHHNPDPSPDPVGADYPEKLKAWNRKNQRERWMQWRICFAAAMDGLATPDGRISLEPLVSLKKIMDLNK